MRLFISFTIFLSLVGCSRKQEGLSSISIKMPAVHGKVGALTALPAGRVACYGVSIRGSGISGIPSNSCHPELGQTLGFVAAGETLQASVPKGAGRTFDVYLYLEPSGESNPCPNMGNSFTALSSQNLYLIGTLPSVDLVKETETITITTTYPGDANHLFAQNSYAPSCLPVVAANKSGYQISTSQATATGAGYILQGRVGRSMSGPELTGTGLKLKLKE
jgi:hypothetical protein